MVHCRCLRAKQIHQLYNEISPFLLFVGSIFYFDSDDFFFFTTSMFLFITTTTTTKNSLPSDNQGVCVCVCGFFCSLYTKTTSVCDYHRLKRFVFVCLFL